MDKIRAIIRAVRKHYPDLPFSEDELVRLALTESSGNPNAQSPKGAYGLFQILIPTARETATRLKSRFPRLFGSVKPEQINPQWLMQNPTKSAFIALEYLSQIHNRISTHTRYTNLSPHEKKTLTLMGYLAGPNRDPIRMAQTPLGKRYAASILGSPPQPETQKRGITNSRGANPNRMEKKLADLLNTHYGQGGYIVQKTADGYRIAARDPNAKKPALIIRVQKGSRGATTRSLFIEGDQNPIGQLQFKAGSHFITPEIEQGLTQRFSAATTPPGNENPAQPRKVADLFDEYYGKGNYTIRKTQTGYEIVPKDPNSGKTGFMIRVQKDQQGKETRTLFRIGDEENPIAPLNFSQGYHYLSPEGETKLRELIAAGENPKPDGNNNPTLFGFFDPLQLYAQRETTPAPTPTAPTQPKPESEKKETTGESATKKTNPMDTFWNNMANVLPMMLLMLAMNPARGGNDYA